MTYTILSAQYADPDNTAVVLQTEEAGAVVVSLVDAPDLWEELQAWGTPDAYVPPPPPPAANPVDKLRTFLDANPDVKALLGL